MYQGDFFKYFGLLVDEREEGKVKHKLIDILFLVISAVICGCNDWTEIHMWASVPQNIQWLKTYIELPYGVPSLSIIARIFHIIHPEQFETCFIHWMRCVVDLEPKDVIPIDGKTMRGSFSRKEGKRGIHIVNALCSSCNLVMGQVKTDEKSNEITAIPDLLDLLFIENCIVTIDAMGAQKKITKKIIQENHADYVIHLKDNQELLHDEVASHFQNLEQEGILPIEKGKQKEAYEVKLEKGKLGIEKTYEKGHGRTETRTYYLSTKIDWMVDGKKAFAGLQSIGMVIREIEMVVGNEKKKTIEESHYICSIDSIQDFSRSVRSHWGIESMHWSLDVTYREDANQVKKGKAPENMAVLKRIALNTVRADETSKYAKKSMKSKRFLAMIDSEYRDYLLNLNFTERNGTE